MRNDIVAVLDLGSSKIVCMIAEISSANTLVVKGVGYKVSEGIRAGIIIDIKQAERAIAHAVKDAEEMAGETIDEVIVNISGSSLKSHHINVETSISGQEITDYDINQISVIGTQNFSAQGDDLLHCFTTFFTIDDSHGIVDPRGMCGNMLSTTLHMVSCSGTALKNIANCLARCHLNIAEMVCTPYASALACLSEDEKQLGATLIDVGGRNTSVAIFAQGNFAHCFSVPIGGDHITRDIAIGLSLDSHIAERIKILYGSTISAASDHHMFIDIDHETEEENGEGSMTDYTEREFPKSSLTSVIRPRAEEILDMVQRKMREDKVTNLMGSRIILTGGGSQLNGFRELANYMFKRQVRLARPKPIENMAESMKGAAFSTAMGMAMHGLSKYQAERYKRRGSSGDETRLEIAAGGAEKVRRWFGFGT